MFILLFIFVYFMTHVSNCDMQHVNKIIYLV